MEDAPSSIDQISDLPNKVLFHILSLLSTKEAAPTFMLSKRWNNIWASLPYLKFDYTEFVQEVDAVSSAKFIGFVNGVLRHRGTKPINEFHLHYGTEKLHPHPATGWVHHIAVNCKPRVLSLAMFIEDYNFIVPSSVLTCASLEELELKFFVLFSEDRPFLPEENIYLPSLKKLELCGLELSNDFFEKLFSGSCLLKTLVLHSCMLGPCQNYLQISSSSLRQLSLRSCDQYFLHDVQIDTPSLIYLDIQSNVNGRIFLKNLRSVVNAQVQSYGYRFGSQIPSYLKHIGALANATTLDLELTSDVMKENLEKELFDFPTFINLKTLVIGKWCMVNDFDLVSAFLEHSPNLQMLKLFHIMCVGSNPGGTAKRASFLKEYLQTVVIDTTTDNPAFELDFLHSLNDEDEAAKKAKKETKKAKKETKKAKKESVELLMKQLCACVRIMEKIKIIAPVTYQFDFDDATVAL